MRQQVLLVEQNLSSPVQLEPITFASAGVWEKQHIQQWVRQHPNLLGEELLIVAEEFDRFQGSADRLDLLAVDRSGNLVVIEFKRDLHGSYSDLQALRYAAMTSAMTIEKLIPHFASYLAKVEGVADSELVARNRIREFIRDAEATELTDRPKIILCSQDFSTELTTTVLWLRQVGVDIACVRLSPFKFEGRVIIVPTKIIPLAEAAAYTIEVAEKETKRVIDDQTRRKNKSHTLPYLLAEGLVSSGDRISLSAYLRPWVVYDPNDPTFHATLTGKTGSAAVRWEKDGKEYSISGLTVMIFHSLDPEKRELGAVNGNAYWTTSSGKTLWELDPRSNDATGLP